MTPRAAGPVLLRQAGPVAVPSDPAEQVEQQLVLLLRRARAGFEQVAREVHPGLEASAYGILHLVDTGTATTVTQLAERLGVGKPTVSRQVTALEALGLVERVADGSRTVQLQLTGDGRARFRSARRRRQQRFRRLLGSWPADDVAALGDLLTRFNDLDW